MALREVANAVRAHGVKIDYENIQDPEVRQALEQVERLFRRLINDIMRNASVKNPADYTLTTPGSLSRTLLDGATAPPATIVNNNNVLAALITDLIALGLIK